MQNAVMLARLRVFHAEEALYRCMHTRGYDPESRKKLAEILRAAKDELLDQLRKYWSEEQGDLNQNQTGSLP